jgi:uncharacterized protein YdeI (YjbR/CyaY-like superfamily)
MHNKQINAYIARAQPFAQPVLNHFRKIVFEVCPEATELLKWSFPVFEYKGPLCNMAAFKAHCAIGFWKAALIDKDEKVLSLKDREAMGHFGRITSLADMPSDNILKMLIKLAMELNEKGIKMPAKRKGPAKVSDVPEAFQTALNKNRACKKVFENFSQSHRNEYSEWIAEAKTAATRNKRIATAMEWIAEGKGRNWKYERK